MYGNTLILDAFWVSNNYFPTALVRDSAEGQEFHQNYPGNARYIGWMDLVLLKQIIQKNNITHIILQNMDALGKIAYKTRVVKVCVAYDYDHFVIRTISKEKSLYHCRPIYEEVVIGGWHFEDNDIELHVRAQHYIRYLLIHTRVDYITCMNSNIKITARWNELGHVVFDTEEN